MAGLTPKQEAFSQAFVEKSNASEAYRTAYAAENMKPEAVHVNASKLLNNTKVALRVRELQAEIKQRHNVTVDSLFAELEEARQAALQAETPQSSAAVAATMGKAKLAGLDKQIVDHRSSDNSMTPVSYDLSHLTFEQLLALRGGAQK